MRTETELAIAAWLKAALTRVQNQEHPLHDVDPDLIYDLWVAAVATLIENALRESGVEDKKAISGEIRDFRNASKNQKEERAVFLDCSFNDFLRKSQRYARTPSLLPTANPSPSAISELPESVGGRVHEIIVPPTDVLPNFDLDHDEPEPETIKRNV